jgi:hypothetical protein
MPKKYYTQAGVVLTTEQCKCVAALERLARKWRKEGRGLWLYSASGTLHVMLDGDTAQNPEPEETSILGVNPNNSVVIITGIPNDGGDW